jgi:hypothetical protein
VPDDLDQLSTPEQRPSALKRLRDHHHLIARLVAEGRRTTDIAAEVGLSVSRVSILKGDPAFKELVEMYRINVEQIRDHNFATSDKKMVRLFDISLDELNERMEENPDQFSPDQILRFAEFTADRTGYGKVSKNLTVSTNLDFSHLDERSAEGRRSSERTRCEARGVAEGCRGGEGPASRLSPNH